jgi:hypothetical protein
MKVYARLSDDHPLVRKFQGKSPLPEDAGVKLLQPVTFNGQTMRVTKLYKDGSFDAVPVPVKR